MQIQFVDHQTLAKLADGKFPGFIIDNNLDDFKALIRNTIDRLSPEQKNIIIMYYFEDATFEQIINETGLNMKQIRKHLAAAKTTLKFALQKAVENRWPAAAKELTFCPICLHRYRREIEKLIVEKPDSQSWRTFNNELLKKFGIKINPPILLKYHIKYHQRG